MGFFDYVQGMIDKYVTPKADSEAKVKDASEAKPEAKPEAKVVQEEAKAQTEAKKADVKVEAAQERVVQKAEVQLDKLKEAISIDNTLLVEAVELRGEEFKEILLPGDLKLDEAGISQKVAKKLEGKDLSRVVEFLKEKKIDVTVEDVKVLLAKMYADAVVAKVKMHITENHPKYVEFIKQYPDNKLICDVVMDSGKVGAVKLSPATASKKYEDWTAEYDKFEDELIARGEKPEEKKATVDEENKAAKINALKTSTLGKLAVWFGFIGKDKVDDEFAAIFDGTHWLSDIVILLGGGGLLSASVDKTSEEILGNLPDKQRPVAEKVIKSASWLSLANVKIKGVVETFEAVTNDLFAKILKDPKEMPKKDFELKDVYEFGKNGNVAALQIDLTDGQMIIPKGATTRIGGKPLTATDKPEPVKGAIVEVTNNIPKGTIFKGKVVFKSLDKATV